MRKIVLVLVVIIGIISVAVQFLSRNSAVQQYISSNVAQNSNQSEGSLLHPLTIASLRQMEFPGSEFIVVEKLEPGVNYSRTIVSYESEGNTIFALLTIPNGPVPEGGWPAIVFNHGYIPPKEYRTTERYIAYTDAFSRNGYVLLRPDYRGHGNSEGVAVGGYGSNAYTIDVLNAFTSLQKYKGVNPQRVGMWGHSMGGFITLRAMVVNKQIRAGVIWAGVVGSYEDIVYNWTRSTYTPPPTPSGVRRWRQTLIDTYGTPKDNPAFWNSISATAFLTDISGPLQIHHGTNDDSVPYQFSEKLQSRMEKEGKASQLFLYEGDDHNIGNNFSLAMERSVAFFDEKLKD